MKCAFCTNKTKIYNSRSTQSDTQTWRRHKCLTCNRTFTTKERVDWTGKTAIASPTVTSPYNRERLLLSIAKAASNLTLPSGAVSDLTDTIELGLQTNAFFTLEIQQSTLITEYTTAVLHRYDPNLALQYVNNVYRNKPPLELLKQLLDA